MSIFNLKQSPSELSSVNSGISKMSYLQHAPTRDVTGQNFSNGQISFKFSLSGQQWWLPSRTYLRLRARFSAGDNPLAALADAALSMDLMANMFQSCEFRIQDKTVSKVSDFVAQVDSLNTRLNKSKSYIDSIGSATNSWEALSSSRLSSVTTFREFIWTPPLSVFGITEALPAGDYELILTPYNRAALGKRLVESKTNVDEGVAATDFAFVIEDLYLYVAEVMGPRSDNMSYYLDLDNIRCQSDVIKNRSFQAKTFNVSPSTYALTVAYQDGRVGTDTVLSSTKFKSAKDTIAFDDRHEELNLNRMYIQFAGQSVPSPDAAPSFDANSDRTVQRYLETQLNSGSLFDTGGSETLDEFHERGSYYHFVIPRDGSDRSTAVQVHQGFAAGSEVDNMRVLLFDHYKSVARVQIREGRVYSVDVEEA